MKNDDIVDHQAVAQVRAITVNEARRVVAGAALIGVAAGALVGGFVYWISGSQAKAIVMLGAFILIGLGNSVHWWRHYHSIIRQLDDLARRVSNGELIYGSQAKFHSYR
jgi:hypothetical protein